MAEASGAGLKAAATVQPSLAVKPAGALGQAGWALYGFAAAPYNVLVNVFVYSAYFTTVVIPDSEHGQVVWSYITSSAALIVALTAPIVGAIADAGGRRKPWILACVVIGVPSLIALSLATPGMNKGLGLVIAALIGGYLSFEYSNVFLNAMLPNVTRPSRIGFLSGVGITMGMLASLSVFTFFLFAWSWNPHPLFGLSAAAHEPERAVGPLAALWLAVFSLPLFFFTPDSPPTHLKIGAAARHGARRFLQTIAKARSYANTANYLIARLIFNEGFIVLILFTGVFAAGILKWTSSMLIVEGLINSVAAIFAGMLAAWLDGKIGAKASTILFVAGSLLANLVLCSISQTSVFFLHLSPGALAPDGTLFPTLPDKVFLITQCSAAFFVTGAVATTRTLMAKLSPPEMLNEFFGLFAFSGTATSFIGPLAIGILTQIFHNQRVGVAVGLFFLSVGGALMFRVKEQPDRVAP